MSLRLSVLDQSPIRKGGTAAQAVRETLELAALCDRLRSEGVEDFHFYTLNRPHLTMAVCRRLGLGPADVLGRVA